MSLSLVFWSICDLSQCSAERKDIIVDFCVSVNVIQSSLGYWSVSCIYNGTVPSTHWLFSAAKVNHVLNEVEGSLLSIRQITSWWLRFYTQGWRTRVYLKNKYNALKEKDIWRMVGLIKKSTRLSSIIIHGWGERFPEKKSIQQELYSLFFLIKISFANSPVSRTELNRNNIVFAVKYIIVLLNLP